MNILFNCTIIDLRQDKSKSLEEREESLLIQFSPLSPTGALTATTATAAPPPAFSPPSSCPSPPSSSSREEDNTAAMAAGAMVCSSSASSSGGQEEGGAVSTAQLGEEDQDETMCCKFEKGHWVKQNIYACIGVQFECKFIFAPQVLFDTDEGERMHVSFTQLALERAATDEATSSGAAPSSSEVDELRRCILEAQNQQQQQPFPAEAPLNGVAVPASPFKTSQVREKDLNAFTLNLEILFFI